MDGINYDLELSAIQDKIKKIRNCGRQTIYNYKTEIVENVGEKQFTDEQHDRLIKFLEDNEKVSRIQKQLLIDTELHRLANQCLLRSEIALPMRSGPWPYDIDFASKVMEEIVNKELKVSYLSYNIQFSPIRFVGDLPNVKGETQLCEYVIKLQKEIFQTVFKTNPKEITVKATWEWVIYPDEHTSGIGNFKFMINDENNIVVYSNEWKNMIMYDVFSYSLNFIIQTKVSSVKTDEKVNDGIEWSPYKLASDTYITNVLGASHVSKSKLIIVHETRNFLPPVIITDTYISETNTYNASLILSKDVIPEAKQDSYLEFKMGMGVHPTGLEEKQDNDDDNEIILLHVIESDIEDRARYDSMMIAKMMELAYYSQWQYDQKLFLDLNVGIDSGIFTNFGSQISTLYKMMLRTLQYEPFETRIDVFNKDQYYPYLLSYGTDVMEVHRVFRTGIWWAATKVNEPMGFIWMNQGDFTSITDPFTSTGKSMMGKFEFGEGATETLTIPVEGGEIIIRYTIVSSGSKLKGVKKTANWHNFMWQTDELFKRDANDNRHIIFKRVLYPRDWNGYKINARSDEWELEIPPVTLTIDQMFIAINGSTIEPVMDSFESTTLIIVIACIEYKTEIISLRPGQYNTTDGRKKFGFFCDLSQTNFKNANAGKTAKSIMRLPDDEKVWSSEKLDWSFKHESPSGDGIAYYNLNILDLTSALGEKFWAEGNVGMTGPTRPEGIKAQFVGTLTSRLESTSQYIMIQENDDFKIPKSYPEMYEHGEKVEINAKWAGRLFGTLLFKIEKPMVIKAYVPRPPQPQDQLWIFDEKMDEIFASLQMLIANWMRDHETLMELLQRVERLEKIVDELVDGSEIQFWIDLVGGVLGFTLPDKGVTELMSLVGNKLSRGFKNILKRKGNSFSWRLADSFAKSKYKRLVEVPEVASELVGDYRIAEQTMKDITVKTTGVPKRLAYGTEKWEKVEDGSKDLIEISGKSVIFEQPEYLKATALIHTGLPKPNILNKAIEEKRLIELAAVNGVRVNEIPFNTAKFYTTPLDIAGEKVGTFFFRFSRKNPNKFDQMAAESFMQNNKRMLHAYTRTEVYTPNLLNNGMTCKVTYAGVCEGITFPLPETNKIWIGAITFTTDVTGRLKDGWVLKLGKFQDSGYSREDLSRLMLYTYGREHNSLQDDTRWKMVWEKLNRRDIYDSHLVYEHRAVDPNRIDAVGRFAEVAEWDYNLLFNNCQTFNRIMFEWVKNGTVPNDAHKHILLNAYIKSLNNDARAYLTGIVDFINRIEQSKLETNYSIGQLGQLVGTEI